MRAGKAFKMLDDGSLLSESKYAGRCQGSGSAARKCLAAALRLFRKTQSPLNRRKAEVQLYYQDKNATG